MRALVFVLLLAASAGAGASAPASTSVARMQVEVLSEGLSDAVAVEPLPNGDILIGERSGRVARVGQPDGESLSASGWTAPGRILDLAAHPDFSRNRLLYLSLIVDENGSRLRVLRGKWNGKGLDEPDIVFPGLLYDPPTDFGGRLAFDNKSRLYLATGIQPMRASDPSDLRGKILRLREDGSIPRENPFIAREGWRSEIFEGDRIGVAGIAIDFLSGLLWKVEGDQAFQVRSSAVGSTADVVPDLSASLAFFRGRPFSGRRVHVVYSTSDGREIRVARLGEVGQTLLTGERGQFRDLSAEAQGTLLVLESRRLLRLRSQSKKK